MGDQRMAAFEYLENLVNAIFGDSDLKDYDVVVELDVGTHAVSNDPFLFVSKDGVGEYIDMPKADIDAQKADGGITFKDVSDLQNDASGANATAAAVSGANVIMNNFGVYNAGEYGNLPFDLENPDTATAEDLQAIKFALENIRGDLINNAAPDVTYTDFGQLDSLTPQSNLEEIKASIAATEGALVNVDAALGAEGILNSMEAGLQDSELTTDQQGIVVEELSNDAAQGVVPAADAVLGAPAGL